MGELSGKGSVGDPGKDGHVRKSLHNNREWEESFFWGKERKGKKGEFHL